MASATNIIRSLLLSKTGRELTDATDRLEDAVSGPSRTACLSEAAKKTVARTMANFGTTTAKGLPAAVTIVQGRSAFLHDRSLTTRLVEPNLLAVHWRYTRLGCVGCNNRVPDGNNTFCSRFCVRGDAAERALGTKNAEVLHHPRFLQILEDVCIAQRGADRSFAFDGELQAAGGGPLDIESFANDMASSKGDQPWNQPHDQDVSEIGVVLANHASEECLHLPYNEETKDRYVASCIQELLLEARGSFRRSCDEHVQHFERLPKVMEAVIYWEFAKIHSILIGRYKRIDCEWQHLADAHRIDRIRWPLVLFQASERTVPRPLQKKRSSSWKREEIQAMMQSGDFTLPSSKAHKKET